MAERRATLCWVLVLTGLLAAACSERPQAPNWQVELQLEPAAPRPAEEVRFAARVRTLAGESVTGAAVEFDLSMPGHRMGENRFRARETEAGIYTGRGRFTMPGTWQVEVRIRRGAQRQTNEFPLEVQ
jgi:nitrogen fixation protein FixH